MTLPCQWLFWLMLVWAAQRRLFLGNTSSSIFPTWSAKPKKMIAQDDIFTITATGLPPPQIPTRNDHPVPRKGIAAAATKPVETNKFYANLFLSDQQESVWTHPYSVQWNRGGGPTQSWGMGISHIDRSMFAFGEGNPNRCK
jgi:endo-1,3(4)-beta-glucanase